MAYCTNCSYLLLYNSVTDSYVIFKKGVKRKIASGRADLDPGWYSAMGQGQAMSLLMLN